MTNRIHYCYLLTRALPEGGCRYYVGIRTAPKNRTPESDSAYMGSGSAIRRAVKAHPGAFSKTVLDVFDTREEAKAMERALVGLETANSKWSYNLREGGQDAGLMSDEAKAKMSDAKHRPARQAAADANRLPAARERLRAAGRSSWASMTPAERSTEMKRRREVAGPDAFKKADTWLRSYWASMTPEERRTEMKRRAAFARENKRRKCEVALIFLALVNHYHGGEEAA